MPSGYSLGIVKSPVDYLRDFPESRRGRLATKLNFWAPIMASQLDGASGAAAAELVASPEAASDSHSRSGFAIFGHGFRANLMNSTELYVCTIRA